MEKILEQARAIFVSRYYYQDQSQQDLIQMLNARLADSFFLYRHLTKAQSTLQNVITCRELDLFGELADQLYTSICQLSSRITELGANPVVSHRTSRMKAYPTAACLLEHVEALNERFTTHAFKLDEGIDLAIRCDDQVTADLLTDMLRDANRALWLFEEQLQG
jgi:starvation-inducible DNA-binding protein